MALQAGPSRPDRPDGFPAQSLRVILEDGFSQV